MQENNQSITINNSCWTATSSVSDEQISQYCANTLSTPTVNVDGQKLYSQQQMIDMFRRGLEVQPSLSRFSKYETSGKINRGIPYHVLKNMDVGQFVLFPFEKWNAVRSCASMLKRVYGCRFRVTKEAPNNQIGRIKAIRLL